jgi:hypothetical protein
MTRLGLFFVPQLFLYLVFVTWLLVPFAVLAIEKRDR